MKTIKKFVVDHKKELGLVAAGVFLYRMGFKTGYNSATNAIKTVVNEAFESLTITRF